MRTELAAARRGGVAVAVAVASMLATAACGDDEGATSPDAAAPPDGGGLDAGTDATAPLGTVTIERVTYALISATTVPQDANTVVVGATSDADNCPNTRGCYALAVVLPPGIAPGSYSCQGDGVFLNAVMDGEIMGASEKLPCTVDVIEYSDSPGGVIELDGVGGFVLDDNFNEYSVIGGRLRFTRAQ